MNHVSVPRHIYKNASIKTNYGNNKQHLNLKCYERRVKSCTWEGITTLTSTDWGPITHTNQYTVGDSQLKSSFAE